MKISSGIIDVDRLYVPHAITCDENNIIVSDSGNHRVLIWTRPITSNFQTPDVVLGQADMISVSANRGVIASPTASTLFSPRKVEYDGTRLFVADASNHRVLIWNSLPTINGQAADLVLGQTLFTTRTSGVSSNKFNNPQGIAIDSSNLYIADSTNNRVLVWSLTTPISSWSNGRAADLVLGQTNFTNNSINRGGVVGLDSLANPIRLISNGTQLALSDYNNRRILVWNTLPTVNGQSADFQLGQISNSARNNMTSTETMISDYKTPFTRSSFLAPSGKLYVASGVNRTLLFNSIDKNYPQSSVVLGQPDFVTTEFPLAQSASTLLASEYVYVDSVDQKIFVSDFSRILIWNSEPTSNNQSADIVLGQTSFTNNTGGISSSRFNTVLGICRVTDKLFVVDGGNNRVLRFTYPLSNGMAADLVLGQVNFTSNTANGGLGFLATQAQALNRPYNLYCDDNHLIVTDSNNNRVLIWNSLPTVNNQAPDVVLGQPDFTSRVENNGGISSKSLSTPRGIASDGTRLFVAEYPNNRILIWNTIPTSNFAPADSVMGQDSFTTNIVDCKSVDSLKISHKCFSPGPIQYIGNNRLLITDYNLVRILILPIP